MQLKSGSLRLCFLYTFLLAFYCQSFRNTLCLVFSGNIIQNLLIIILFFFFFHPIFDNLVAIILFSLSSIPLNFGNLIATIGFFFFPFEHFSFGHFIDLGRKIQAEGILVTSLLKFNSFLTPTITSFLFPLSSFFVRILAIMLSKFASLLNLPNNF